MSEEADHIDELTKELIEATEEISKLKGDKETFEMVKSGVGSFELATDKDKEVTIKGIALKEGRWKNYYYSKEEIMKGAKSLVKKPLVVDHGKGVRDIVGQIVAASWDDTADGLSFEAEIIERNVATLIKRGLVRGVSVGSDFDTYDGPNGLSVRDIQFYELALTTHPACLNGVTEILHREFPGATDKDLSDESKDNTSLKEKEEDIMSEEKTETKAPETVEETPDTETETSETPETTEETPKEEETKAEEPQEEVKEADEPVEEEKKASVDVNVNVNVTKEEPEKTEEEEPAETVEEEESTEEEKTEEAEPAKEEEKAEEPEKEAEKEPEKEEEPAEEAKTEETEDTKEETEDEEEKDPHSEMTTAELLTEKARLRNPETVPK